MACKSSLKLPRDCRRFKLHAANRVVYISTGIACDGVVAKYRNAEDPQEINGEVLTPDTNRAADAPPRLNIHVRGGAAPPPPRLFFDQNEARRAEKNVFGDRGPPLSRGLDDRPSPPPRPPISEGLDPPLKALPFSTLGFVTRMQSLIKASQQNKSTASMRVRRRECMPLGC